LKLAFEISSSNRKIVAASSIYCTMEFRAVGCQIIITIERGVAVGGSGRVAGRAPN